MIVTVYLYIFVRRQTRDYVKIAIEVLLVFLVIYTIYSFYEDQVCISMFVCCFGHAAFSMAMYGEMAMYFITCIACFFWLVVFCLVFTPLVQYRFARMCKGYVIPVATDINMLLCFSVS